MPVGKMRHRINIQTIARVADGMGGNAHSFSTTVSVWGSVEPMVGNERVEGGQIESRQRYKFTLRYNSNLTVDDRLNYDSKNFRILSIQKKYDIDKYQTVIAEEGVAT
jgi:SPP1 family predicted phage head-tail adaptor